MEVDITSSPQGDGNFLTLLLTTERTAVDITSSPQGDGNVDLFWASVKLTETPS